MSTHPEARPGEVYVDNLDRKGFAALRQASKRVGDRMCDAQGQRTPGKLPCFVHESEAQATSKRRVHPSKRDTVVAEMTKTDPA